MLIKQAFLWLILCFPLAALTVGCGEEAAPGAAEDDDDSESETTEEDGDEDED